MDKAQQVTAFIDNMENLHSQGAPIDWQEVCVRIKKLMNTPTAEQPPQESQPQEPLPQEPQ